MSVTVHPAFRARLGVEAAQVEHEGDLVGEGLEVYTRSLDGLTLLIAVDGTPAVVRAARHKGASDDRVRAVCEMFCRWIEGVPLQEAAEHGVLYLIERLRDPQSPAPIRGIRTPRNCGPPFQVLAELARAVFEDCLARRGQKPEHNTWNPKLHADWLNSSESERIDILTRAIELHLRREGAAAGSIWVSDIESGRRVVIGFAGDFPANDKPSSVLGIERIVRELTASRIEVYSEEMSDGNAIRRL